MSSKERKHDEHPESSRAKNVKTFFARELWKNLPEDLQHVVLLWLPAASQARLSRVCRRWRKVMKSASSRERSTEIAWKLGCCTAIFSGKQYRYVSGDFKVHKVSLDTFPSDFPHDVFASGIQSQWLSHGGVLAWPWRMKTPYGSVFSTLQMSCGRSCLGSCLPCLVLISRTLAAGRQGLACMTLLMIEFY